MTIAAAETLAHNPSLGAPRFVEGGELRLLMLSHMDPRLSNGGAELAAYQLYNELRARPNVTAWFMSAAPGKMELRDGVTFAQPFGADSYLYAARAFDHFNFSNPDGELRGELTALLKELQPNVIHLHHYTNFGLEVLATIRRALPHARIVLTLHEYLAICNHFGQMVKRPTFSLCERSGPRPCHACFPEHSPQDFFMRELFIKRFFREVDQFISPSRFLAERYIAWGLPRERMAVVENGVPNLDQRGLEPLPTTERGLRVGFFGQISRLKGIDVLMDAAELLQQEASPIQIEVYGDDSSQPEAFRDAFRARLKTAPGIFSFRGAYDNRRVDQLMQSVHAVLVPSIWWENSPLVIQEALANRRSIITSDIGGMAEKVRDGLDGFHFQAGNGWSLAALLRRLAADPQQLAAIQQTMQRPPSLVETADAITALYLGAPAEAGQG